MGVVQPGTVDYNYYPGTGRLGWTITDSVRYASGDLYMSVDVDPKSKVGSRLVCTREFSLTEGEVVSLTDS